MSQSLILVGPMGAGKSTIGKSLSQKLKLPLIDIDQLVVDNAGADIPWIFDVEGEDGFRRRESAALIQALSADAAVIATGGGIVKLVENRQKLHGAKAVVYLNTSIDQQLERTAKDKNRPLLQQDDPRGVLQKLMAERAPFYEEVSDFVVGTDSNGPTHIVDKIVKYWKSLP